MTLYEITGEILELYNMLEDGADENTVNDTLEAVMDDFKDKADGYGAFIRNVEAEAAAYDTEIKRLQAKKKTAENMVARLKGKIKEAMKAAKKDEIKGSLFKFSLKNGSPQLPKNISLDDLAEDIRGNYEKVKDPELDKTKLLKDVKAGVVKGIDLVYDKSLMMK